MNILLNIGVLGCGMIGHSFLRQAHTVPGISVTAVCSPSPASRQSALTLWPAARAHADRGALLRDPGVDAILVCTPHAYHADDAIAALAAGKHVLIEKPIATSLDQLAQLEVTAERCDRVVVGLPLTDHTALTTLTGLIGSGIIGPPMEFSSALDVPGPPRSNWYYSKNAIAGPALDTLPYALARLLSLTGTTITGATVSTTQAIHRRRCLDGGSLTQDVEDHISMHLTFPTGQQALVKSSWCLHRPEDYLIIRGRSGDIRLNCWRNRIHIRSDTAPEQPHHITTWDDTAAFRIDLPRTNPEHAKLTALASAVDSNTSILTDTAYTMRLILAALQTRNGAVAIPPPPPIDIGGPRTTVLDLRIGEEYL